MILSVVMSCYNAAKTLESAVESILSQTLADFELIMINDASTDNTLEKLLAYQKQDARIKILSNTKNIGLAASLNKGIYRARTNLIARMDADDIAHPERLEKQYNFLTTHPDIDILGTGIKRVSTDGRLLGTASLYQNDQDIKNQIFNKPPVYHPTAMIKKEVFEKYGYYDPEIRWAEDADLWYRIQDHVTFHNLQEPLLTYTVKDKLPFTKAKKNFTLKYQYIKKRNQLFTHTPTLLKEMIILSKNMITSH